jgi:ADP-heptose:LPS heptosyltransferase
VRKVNIGIPSDAEMWEVVAAIQVCQSQGILTIENDAIGDAAELYQMAGLLSAKPRNRIDLDFSKAYRAIATVKETYQAMLARASGLESKPISVPQFSGFTPSMNGGIIVCSHEVTGEFKLPWQVWRAIVRHLRSYGQTVRFLGRPGERMDYATFTEGQILSNLSLQERMQVLASAGLVVGVPNEWTWISTAWKKKVLVMQPDDVPQERWFGFDVAPQTLGRLLYTRSQLQVPVILAGLRKLISVM